MSNPTTFPGDVIANKGQLRHKNDFAPAIDRDQFATNSSQLLWVPWSYFRTFDAFATNLPGTPATDDLGLVGGTFGSATPSLQTEDLKAAGATNNRARAVIALPIHYLTGQDIKVRARAGMLTTVADNSATLDCELYASDNEAGVGSDLVSTSATDINSLTLADIDFNVDGSGLSPGDQLDFRLTTAVNDGATGTAVKAIIGGVWLVIPTRP